MSVLTELEGTIRGLTMLAPCPKCLSFGYVSNVVLHLNDTHGSTREFIADWLDSLDIDLSFPTPDRMDR